MTTGLVARHGHPQRDPSKMDIAEPLETEMRLLAVLPVALCVLGSVGASAQTDRLHITPEEHAACDNDAVRLCSDAYPDEAKMLGCMRSQRDQLTPECSSTFDAGLRKRHMRM